MMFISSFDEIRKHVLSFENQNKKWIVLINNHLSRLFKDHINFILNADELVEQCLNLFFIL